MRDLSKLNRDLSNVLLITSDPDAFFLQPDNAIKVRIVRTIADVHSQSSAHDTHSIHATVVRTSVPWAVMWQGFASPAMNASYTSALSVRSGSRLAWVMIAQLEPWKLDAEDTALLDHLPFLEAIVRSGA